MDKREKRTKRTSTNIYSKVGKVNASDITTGMVEVIVICWLIPFLTLSIVLFYYSNKNSEERVSGTIQTSLVNAGMVCKNTVSDIVKESKQASYDGVILDSYKKYLAEVRKAEEAGDLEMMHKMKDSAAETLNIEVNNYLGSKYKYNKMLSSTYVYFVAPELDRCYTIGHLSGATYSSVSFRFATDRVESKVREASKTIGTEPQMMVIGGQLYLVRNLVDRSFEPYAIIVMDLNEDNLFNGITNIVWSEDKIAFADGVLVDDNKKRKDDYVSELQTYCEGSDVDETVDKENSVVSFYNHEYMWGMTSFWEGQNQYSFGVVFEKDKISNDVDVALYMYVIIILLLIPLLGATVAYFYKNVSYPIARLMYASEKIEKGKYGYQLEPFYRNQEFGKLIDVFNDMSASLKNSFEKIYIEEIAVRDANMQALQAQINPHFLNNTLEIINWKARIAGNDDVSGMIESLGVMMEATMNRKGESFITIREEMTYVDAYLYIIEQRFGELFSFEKDVDESLYDIKIPRLIIQPLVENMVEHGADETGKRVGKLRMYADNKNLYIEVENNGTMSDEDRKRVAELLSDLDYTSKKKNIGIRNVNIRLRMLYGRTSGLTIKNEKNGVTISKIVIELNKLSDESNKNMQNSAN